MMQPFSSYALLALPAAVALLLGTCQAGGGSQALEPGGGSSSSGGGGSSETTGRDSLLLVNRTDAGLLYKAFNPKTARPLAASVQVDLSDPPPEYVAAGDSTALWPCDALDAYEDYTLHLYRVDAPEGSAATVSAPRAKSIRASSARLAEWQRSDCRLELRAW